MRGFTVTTLIYIYSIPESLFGLLGLEFPTSTCRICQQAPLKGWRALTRLGVGSKQKPNGVAHFQQYEKFDWGQIWKLRRGPIGRFHQPQWARRNDQEASEHSSRSDLGRHPKGI